MTDFNPATQHSTETAWLATRYALGELNEGECRAFEEQLANDQHARDCLVEAVRLLDACGSIGIDVATVRRRDRRASRLPFLMATAATIAMLLAGAWFAARAPRPGQEQLASRSTTLEAVEIMSRWAASSEPIAEEELVMADDLARDSMTELLPPEWLLAAVAQEEVVVPMRTPFEETSPRVERN